MDTQSMQQIAQISGGDFHTASTPDELAAVYSQLGDQIGYETTQQTCPGWTIASTLLAILDSAAAVAAGRRIPDRPPHTADPRRTAGIGGAPAGEGTRLPDRAAAS